jgi:large subunit ribosomal protein L24
MQIKKNDTVLVNTGKEKGKRGRVIAVYPAENRLLVEKLNMIKRHTRPNQQLKQGGIMEKESPISVSNVRLICSKCDKPTTITRKAFEGDKRSRVCTNCNEILD